MSELKKEKYYISGMHCRSCEILIEGNISEIKGVKKVEVNHRKGIAEIYYENNKPRQEDIETAVRNAGYTLGVDKARPLFSSNPNVYFELIYAGGILFVVYAWLRIFGILDLGLEFDSKPSLLVVILIGLTAGISTCMALIGGLVLGISSRHARKHPEATALEKFKPHLYFNLGRLASFAVLGGLIGLLGSVFQFSSQALGFLVIFAGVIMLFLGLKMTELFPRLDNGILLMPKRISRLFKQNSEDEAYSHKNALITGAITFFLPCGFTQAMQIYAVSTGSFAMGSAIMFLFALGTTPGLLGIGGLTSVVKGKIAKYFFKFVALLLLVLAFWNISNGFNLTGLNLPAFNSINIPGEPSVKIINGEQIIEITQSGSGYSPKKVTVKKDIPVRMIITGTNPYSCSSFFVIPKFNLSKRLLEGPNELTFTPTETGPIKFSCSMGMYTGIINVIN